jgi:hypothetical protein
MGVVRLRPAGHACRECGSSLDVPHKTLFACERALHVEMAATIERMRELHAKRARIHRKRTRPNTKTRRSA